MSPRLTYKDNGRWMYAGGKEGKRRPIKANPLLLAFRACDRVFIGRDNGRNDW